LASVRRNNCDATIATQQLRRNNHACARAPGNDPHLAISACILPLPTTCPSPLPRSRLLVKVKALRAFFLASGRQCRVPETFRSASGLDESPLDRAIDRSAASRRDGGRRPQILPRRTGDDQQDRRRA
jgi:hypothetical protein